MGAEVKPIPGIYCFTFPDGSKYIGGSSDVRARIFTHLSWLRNGGGQTKALKKAYTMFGVPKIKVLQYCDREDLRELELNYHDLYKPTLNKRQKGGAVGVKIKDTSKMREAAKK